VRGLLPLWIGIAAAVSAQSIAPISWSDLPPAIQQRLERTGLDRDRFPAWTTELRARHAARVREGDEDHLVFYALQSTRTTNAPRIEPALSARTLVDRLDADARMRFFSEAASLPADRIPQDARARLRALVQSADGAASDPRLGYFRALLQAAVPPAPSHEAWRAAADAHVARAYLRAMRFLAEQARAGQTREAADAIATLYRTRGLSTDTSVEAGFLVHVGLATLRALEARRRVSRVVIIGPGLDLAPRTGFQEAIPPQSVQPFAVADALISLGLTDPASLRITCLDINPRVVDALDRGRGEPRTLTLSPAIEAAAGVSMSDEFRRYVETLGLAIGSPLTPTLSPTSPKASSERGGGSVRRVAIRHLAADTIEARTVDIVLDRLPLEAELIVVTNVLSYFDDRELALALANVAAMLAPGGILLHNEARPEVGAITAAIGVPLVQSRTAVIATVGNGPPLYDSVFMHRKQ
jgi:hypothetical protein